MVPQRTRCPQEATLPTLTQPQAVAIRICLESPANKVSYRRGFLTGRPMPPRCIPAKVAHALAKKGYGQTLWSQRKDEGHFVLNDQGADAYVKHRKERTTTMSQNETVAVNETAEAPKVEAAKPEAPKAKAPPKAPAKAKPEAELLAPNGKPPVTISIDPALVEIPADTEHPLYDRRAAEPLDERVQQDIMANGIRVPIAIRQKPDCPGVYEIIDGRTRLRVAREINHIRGQANKQPMHIPAQLFDAPTNLEAAALKHAFNELRNQRDLVGKAEGIVEMLKLGMKQDEVAKLFGVVARSVRRYKTLIEQGCPELKKALRAGEISLVNAVDLASNYDEENQVIVLEEMRQDAERHKKLCQGKGESGEETEDSDEEAPPERKSKPKAKSLKRDFVLPLLKDLRKNKLNDKNKEFTAEDMKNAMVAGMGWVAGDDHGAKKLMDELEAIGFGEAEDNLQYFEKPAKKKAGKGESKKAGKGKKLPEGCAGRRRRSSRLSSSGEDTVSSSCRKAKGSKMGKKLEYVPADGEEVMQSASRHMTKVPHVVFARNGMAIETVWEMGYRRYFVAPGINKPKRKSAEYLGELFVEKDGTMRFRLAIPSRLPSHKSETMDLVNNDFFKLLGVAVAARRRHREGGR